MFVNIGSSAVFWSKFTMKCFNCASSARMCANQGQWSGRICNCQIASNGVLFFEFVYFFLGKIAAPAKICIFVVKEAFRRGGRSDSICAKAMWWF